MKTAKAETKSQVEMISEVKPVGLPQNSLQNHIVKVKPVKQFASRSLGISCRPTGGPDSI